MGTGTEDKRGTGAEDREERELEKAFKYIYRILSRKDYTEMEIIKKLKERNFSEEVIEEVIRILKEERYIDDREYVERFIHDAINIKRRGPLWIKRELFKRGVNEEIVNELLSKYRKSFLKLIEEMYPEVMKRYTKDNIKERKRKAWNYFMSRGFYTEDIKEVMSVGT